MLDMAEAAVLLRRMFALGEFGESGLSGDLEVKCTECGRLKMGLMSSFGMEGRSLVERRRKLKMLSSESCRLLFLRGRGLSLRH